MAKNAMLAAKNRVSAVASAASAWLASIVSKWDVQ
jgi:hypothetical protein